MPARMLGPEEGWIVMSHIGWGGEQNTLIREWKPDLVAVPHRIGERNECQGGRWVPKGGGL